MVDRKRLRGSALIMSSSSPISSPQSSHNPSVISSSRAVQRTYSRRLTTRLKKRKAQAAPPSSDTEGSDDNEIHAAPHDLLGRNLSEKRRDHPDGRISSPKRTARWSASVEGDEAEGVEGTDPRRSSISKLEESFIPASSTRSFPEGRKQSVNGRKRRGRLQTPADAAIRGSGGSGPMRKCAEPGPDINLERPSSSWAIKQTLVVPPTPPRPVRPPITPYSSPRDLSASLAAVSPGRSCRYAQDADMQGVNYDGGSDSQRIKPIRPGGSRRMLAKSQSLGSVPPFTSKPTEMSVTEDDTAFGKAASESGPSTPTRALGNTQSLPESRENPSVSHGNSLLVPGTSLPPQDSSDGKVKRTYGHSRTLRVESSKMTMDSRSEFAQSDRDDGVAKESYAELRKRYEVDHLERSDNGLDIMTVRLDADRS